MKLGSSQVGNERLPELAALQTSVFEHLRLTIPGLHWTYGATAEIMFYYIGDCSSPAGYASFAYPERTVMINAARAYETVDLADPDALNQIETVIRSNLRTR